MSVCSGCVKSTACNSRQSQIELLIEEQGIELEAAKNPPYELYK